jgi:23S rRNA pseudouridine1911/1915/1917 synthase
MNIKILYEDNHIIAVVKPAGVLTQGDKSGEESLMDMVKNYLKEKYKKPGNVFLGLVHRLDKPVQGIVLFGKTSKGASRLSEQFRNHEIEKIYYAIVIGKPKENIGTLINFLSKDEKVLKAKDNQNGKESILYYETVKSNNKYSLLKIKLETGKFHQIRAQLSLAEFPILGDAKYGALEWENKNSIALCAIEISFRMATEDKIINLKIPLPEEWEKYL